MSRKKIDTTSPLRRKRNITRIFSTEDLSRESRLLIEQYTEYLQASGLSRTTVTSYTIESVPFLRYLEECSITDLSTIRLADIQGYCGSLNERLYCGRPLSGKTRAIKMQRVRSLCRYLQKSGKIESDPAANMTMPRIRKNLPRNIPEINEMLELMEKPDMKSPIGMRDRAILELMYSTAVRNTELRALECEDVDLEERIINVTGKGGKYAQIPFGREAASALHNYLEYARHQLLGGYRVTYVRVKPERVKRESEMNLLFISAGGFGMSTQDIEWVVDRYAKRIGRKMTPHTLRHACATHLLRRGADIRYIQQLLRHEHLNTTQIYTHVAIEDLKEAQRRFHPRETDEPA